MLALSPSQLAKQLPLSLGTVFPAKRQEAAVGS